MKKFIVNFVYELSGSIEVEAKSQKKAGEKLFSDLEYYGLEDLHKVNKNKIDPSQRDWDIL